MGGINLDPFQTYAFNSFGPGGRSILQSANKGMESLTSQRTQHGMGIFGMGVIKRASAGSYDVLVQSQDGPAIPCMVLTNLTSYYMGVSDCYIPIEGSKVVYYMAEPAAKVGYVIGTVPDTDLVGPTLKTGTPPKMLARLWEVEPGATSATEKPHQVPFEDPDNGAILNSNAGRPLDLFPGNRAWINEQGVGLAILNFIASIRGSERAKIEVSAIDDMVRMVSGYFRHQSSIGEDAIYNDGGFLTEAETSSLYQFERFGYDQYTKAFVPGGNIFLSTPNESKYQLPPKGLMPKSRLHVLTGHLGDIINTFVCKPDPDFNPETPEDDSKHQGLFHQHVDSSGRLIVRSAAGISLQRYDRIPVPKRKKEPWDPEGDLLEDLKEAVLEEKKPFEFDEEYPYSRALVLRDSNAWYNRMAYQRLHSVSETAGRTDWYLPEEMDLKTPDDEYDKYGKAKEDFQEHDDKSAYINVEPDGSIILRDNWGSEIIMRGGNIVITCPGQLELRPGKSLVQLAGHDVITKARKSVDISATDHDLRLKAKHNLHAVAGDSSGETGGILLESKAESEYSQFEDVTGEQVRSKGIIFKAKDSRIFGYSKTVHLSGGRRIILEGFEEDGTKPRGDLITACRNSFISSERAALITVRDEAGFIATAGFAATCGQSAFLLGGSSAGVIQGSDYHVPLMLVSIGTNPYEEAFVPAAWQVYEFYHNRTDWLEPFKPDQRAQIEFTYRSSAEYGTIDPTEVGPEKKEFAVYEASWSYLARVGYKFIEGSTEKWEEEDIEDTWPWPGELYYNGKPAYVKLEDEQNIQDKAIGLPNKRESVQNEPGPLNMVAIDEYEVMEHN